MAKLLVVDHHSSSRFFLKKVILHEGHHVIESRTGEECLSLVTHEKPDMILLDEKLPEMNGYTCCSKLRELLKEKCPTILMMIGKTDESSINQSLAVGAVDYVTKPISELALIHRIQKGLYERELLHQLSAVKQLLATANRELQHVTRIDKLTQLYNRQYFEEVITREWGRLCRYQRSLGMILCDIDAFKQYNDLHGYDAGNSCLKDISKVLRRSLFRSSDCVARYGGGKFAILLPETDAPGTLTVARRIHVNLENTTSCYKEANLASAVTLSMGIVSIIPKKTNSLSHFFAFADLALQDAKAQGGSCIILKNMNDDNVR